MSEGTENEASSQTFGTANTNRPGMSSGGTRLNDSANNSGFNSQSCQCWRNKITRFVY